MPVFFLFSVVVFAEQGSFGCMRPWQPAARCSYLHALPLRFTRKPPSFREFSCGYSWYRNIQFPHALVRKFSAIHKLNDLQNYDDKARKGPFRSTNGGECCSSQLLQEIRMHNSY
jgi:hypothetical protein